MKVLEEETAESDTKDYSSEVIITSSNQEEVQNAYKKAVVEAET